MTSRVLVVDDEPLLKSLIIQKFKQEIKSGEMEFLFAANGDEALDTLKQNTDVGVVLTDINMPGMDGLTLLSQLVNQSRIYQTVVISAYADISNIRKAMNNGASDFITKPIDLQDLDATLKYALNEYSYMKEMFDAKCKLLEINKELYIGERLQRSFIPKNFEPFGPNCKLKLYGEMDPAREVGGDFFDFYVLNESELAFIIADVSGKGIPASLFVSMIRTLFRSENLKSGSIAESMKTINAFVNENNDSSMFVTAFVGVINVVTGQLNYVNAGHNTSFLFSKGEVRPLALNEGIALGVVDEIDDQPYAFKEKKIQLLKDDLLLFYTDGITEAFNSQGHMYSEGRLKEFIASRDRNISLPHFVQQLKAEIAEYMKGMEQFDDMTLLLARFTG